MRRVLLALLLVSPCAAADEVDRARTLGQSGNAAYDRSDFETARAFFHQAREMFPAPTLGVREARCLVQLGRLVEASHVYERVIATHATHGDPEGDPAVYDLAIKEAYSELSALGARTPRLTLDLAGPSTNAHVTLDGAPYPRTLLGNERPLDPGLHTIAGTIDGERIPPTTFTLREREHRTIAIDTPSRGRDAARTTGVGLLVLGAAGLGAGAGLGIAAISEHQRARPEPAVFSAFAIASTVALAVGGIAIVAGGIVLLRVGAGSATVEGTFQ